MCTENCDHKWIASAYNELFVEYSKLKDKLEKLYDKYNIDEDLDEPDEVLSDETERQGLLPF